MEKEEMLLELTEKEISLSDVVTKLELNEYEVLGLVKNLREKGINISVKKYDDDIYLFNQGEKEINDTFTHKIDTNEYNEFKFIAISDTIIGSKYQQLSILEDIYEKGHEMGYDNVILCGNLSSGLFPITSIYSDSNFLNDTMLQTNYIIDNYPKIEGMKTYFLLGPKDEKHLLYNKINIGKRISEARDDMIYLGFNSCEMDIDKTKMFVMCPKLSKTYTVSYRTQQQIDSFRSEDKPDILLLGGLLQMEKYPYRDVKVLSIPSVCATTKEMTDKRYQNTVGAWYITIKTNKKGYLENLKAIDSIYYVTDRYNYTKVKTLKKVGGPNGQ